MQPEQMLLGRLRRGSASEGEPGGGSRPGDYKYYDYWLMPTKSKREVLRLVKASSRAQVAKLRCLCDGMHSLSGCHQDASARGLAAWLLLCNTVGPTHAWLAKRVSL